MLNITAEQAAQLHETGGLPLLGHTLSWLVRDVDTPHKRLVDALKAHDLTAWVPNATTPREALRRALYEWIRSERGNLPRLAGDSLKDDGTGSASRSLVRPLNDPTRDVMRFALVTEHVNLSDLGLSYGAKVYFTLNKRTGDFLAVIIEDSQMNDRVREEREREFYRAVAPKYLHYREQVTSADVARAVRVNVVETMAAISLRENGGYYFVPATQSEKVEQLRAFFADLSDAGDLFLLALPQIDTAAAKRELAQFSHIAFEQEIATLTADVQLLLDRKTVKPETLHATIGKVQQVRAKAESYGALLNMRQDTIASALDQVLALTKRVMSETEIADDEPTSATTDAVSADTAAAK